ncbi:uncharacterized protein OCT59_013801 [Rhizophagus irregularis]|uniref:Uncharacterized protein n=2 Tax=Rhizophagus irregularis TaxID=588596 RepID=A0A915ZZ25_9GLOM|nr:hypothetical protein OCT59_013801 [Rhizophagus irregularis]GET59043.1 hypothetical protein GLOIN_2v1598434 [Rhizophagus irregularis DAOM 181602=DAOM 197198]CAB5214133.1 unnamed protein product [Rhizophagus irregularis]CAB5394446.1 unnamed protein product [Rhizophagus irregularis]
MEIQDIDELLDEAFPNIKENEKPHIKWLLQSFNPVPLEFYRYLNRKTKYIATNAFTHALRCQMLLAKRGWECLENPATMEVFAERSAHMSIKACYNVQRSYNYEVSAYSTRKRKHNSPSTPNKPVIRPEVDQKYPQISFSKKLKVAFKELDDENPRNSGEK